VNFVAHGVTIAKDEKKSRIIFNFSQKSFLVQLNYFSLGGGTKKPPAFRRGVVRIKTEPSSDPADAVSPSGASSLLSPKNGTNYLLLLELLFS